MFQIRVSGKLLRTMSRQGLASIDVEPEAQERHNQSVQEQMRGTVWTSGGCASWYLDKRGRNTTLWSTYTFHLRSLVQRFDAENYLGRPREDQL